jgi:hypothetical protein
MKAIYILLLAVAITSILGCVAQDRSASLMSNSIALMKYLPQNESSPQGFNLVLIENDLLNEPKKNIIRTNLTDYIKNKGFMGPKDIGPFNATLARYKQAESQNDAIVALVALKDEEHAQAAVANYILNYRQSHIKEIEVNATLINTTIINKHSATEIKESSDDGGSYLYLWNNKSITVWVLGNTSKEASFKLASATGL